MTDKLKTPLEGAADKYSRKEYGMPKVDVEKDFKAGAEWQKTHGEGLRWVLASERLPDTVSIPVRWIGSHVVFMELVETLIRSWDLTTVEWLEEHPTHHKHPPMHYFNKRISHLYEGCNITNMKESNLRRFIDGLMEDLEKFGHEDYYESNPVVKESLTAQKEQSEIIEFVEWIEVNQYRRKANGLWFDSLNMDNCGEQLTTHQLIEKFRHSKQSKNNE